MSNLIDEEIIKRDLLKNISDKYGIDYNLLLEDLNCLTQFKTVNTLVTTISFLGITNKVFIGQDL